MAKQKATLDRKHLVDIAQLSEVFVSTFAVVGFDTEFRVKQRNTLFDQFFSFESTELVEVSSQSFEEFSRVIRPLIKEGKTWQGTLEFIGSDKTLMSPSGFCLEELNEMGIHSGFLFVFSLQNAEEKAEQGRSEHDVAESSEVNQDEVVELRKRSLELSRSLEQKTAELEDSKESFNKIAELVPVFIWKCDAEGVNEYLSPQWNDYTGQTKTESAGTGWLDAVHIKDRDRVVSRWSHSVSTGIPMDTEYRLRDRDGVYKWFSAQGIAAFDENGEIEAWYGASKNIDDEKRQSQDLLRYTQELERSNYDLEQFAHIASHDLQEPLRMVVSFSDIIADDYSEFLDEKGLEYLGYIVDGGKRMQSLINDVLHFSRVLSEDSEKSLLDTKSVIESVIFNFRRLINETDAIVEVEDLPRINCDHEQLIQISQNLISNGLKFRSKDSPKMRIYSEQLGNGFNIIFEDNGIGIQKEHRSRIFRMFQRLNTRDKYSGTGIGLAIVKKIVDANDWSISVSSVPGSGSRFKIFIPNSDIGEES